MILFDEDENAILKKWLEELKAELEVKENEIFRIESELDELTVKKSIFDRMNTVLWKREEEERIEYKNYFKVSSLDERIDLLNKELKSLMGSKERLFIKETIKQVEKEIQRTNSTI